MKFLEDLKRKELIPIKILMFLIYAGQATLYPYFSIHLKSLGVSIKQTTIIFAVQPIIALLVAPMVGMAADKIGNFRAIFSFFLLFSAVTANLLIFIPPVPLQEKLFYFNLECENSTFTMDREASCELKSTLNETDVNMTLVLQCQGTWKDDSFPILLCANDLKFSKYFDSEVGNECVSVNEDNLNFEFKFKNSNQSEEDRFWIHYMEKRYHALRCSECTESCNFISQDPVKDCVDVPINDEFGATFWSYLGVRLVITLGIGLVNGLFDAASMTIIQELKADVGFQRFWSTVAMCIFAPISGYLVDTFHSFRPCFFMYGILYLAAAITSFKLDLSMKLPSSNPIKNLAKLLRNPEVILLLIHIAVLGICWGFLENFLFWFLERDLESNTLIMGLTVTVGSGTGLFMALVATWCTRKLGYVNVILVAFAAYTVRFFGYSIVQDAYSCLIFEMMENFTVTLLTVGVTLYCTELASLEMLTTIMTLWNGLHIISGRAFGSLLGGFLVEYYGFRKTFQYFAYISLSFGLFYAFIYVIWLRKWRSIHRKESIDKRRKSTVLESKEDEAMKTEAFSSLPMYCSFDSPNIIHFIPDSPIDSRRRALSDVPVKWSNSFRLNAPKPRHAFSFSEHSKTPQPQPQPQPLSIVLESPQIIMDPIHFTFPNSTPIENSSEQYELSTRL